MYKAHNLQVSMSAPAIFPFVPKCIRMNFPCQGKNSHCYV